LGGAVALYKTIGFSTTVLLGEVVFVTPVGIAVGLATGTVVLFIIMLLLRGIFVGLQASTGHRFLQLNPDPVVVVLPQSSNSSNASTPSDAIVGSPLKNITVVSVSKNTTTNPNGKKHHSPSHQNKHHRRKPNCKYLISIANSKHKWKCSDKYTSQ